MEGTSLSKESNGDEVDFQGEEETELWGLPFRLEVRRSLSLPLRLDFADSL